jgi:hypothetical protein
MAINHILKQERLINNKDFFKFQDITNVIRLNPQQLKLYLIVTFYLGTFLIYYDVIC